MDLKKLIIEYIGFDPDNEQKCLEAVKNEGYNIRYIKNPSIELQLEAVKRNGYVIQYINNPSEEIKLAAVKENAFSIWHIKNPSIEIQKTAIKSSGYNIKIIALCPDWKEFEQEIIDNLMIKDIIE